MDVIEVLSDEILMDVIVPPSQLLFPPAVAHQMFRVLVQVRAVAIRLSPLCPSDRFYTLFRL